MSYETVETVVWKGMQHRRILLDIWSDGTGSVHESGVWSIGGKTEGTGAKLKDVLWKAGILGGTAWSGIVTNGEAGKSVFWINLNFGFQLT